MDTGNVYTNVMLTVPERKIWVEYSKYVIVFDFLFTFNTRPYAILADNSIYLDRIVLLNTRNVALPRFSIVCTENLRLNAVDTECVAMRTRVSVNVVMAYNYNGHEYTRGYARTRVV